MLHKDVAQEVTRWIERLNMDPHNHLLQRLLEKLDGFDSQKLLFWTIGTLFYAALFLTEGTGLLLLKRWGEYFAVIITGSFVPLEIYELFKKFYVFKVVIIAVNAAIVWYLILRLKRDRPSGVRDSKIARKEALVTGGRWLFDFGRRWLSRLREFGRRWRTSVRRNRPVRS